MSRLSTGFHTTSKCFTGKSFDGAWLLFFEERELSTVNTAALCLEGLLLCSILSMVWGCHVESRLCSFHRVTLTAIMYRRCTLVLNTKMRSGYMQLQVLQNGALYLLTSLLGTHLRDDK